MPFDDLLSDEEWVPYFDAFQQSIFRLETLPEYRVEADLPTYEAFLRGDPAPDIASWGWPKDLRQWRSEGKIMRRVHVVRSPLSDYLRYEMGWHYPVNSSAGEDIRILDLTTTPDPGLPDQDFWLFDDERVVRMVYDTDGTQTSRRKIPEGSDISQWLVWRDLAWENSTPFADYYAHVNR